MHSEVIHDDAFHFTNTDPMTLIYCMDDDDDMPEAMVRDHISHTNPILYEKLNRLPVSSYDIPMSWHGLRRLRQLNNTRCAIQLMGSCSASASAQNSPAMHELQHPKAIPSIALLRHNIEQKLAAGFTICKTFLKDAPTTCSLDRCKASPNYDRCHDYFVVTLSPTKGRSESLSQPGEYYSAHCYDLIFSGTKLERQTTKSDTAPERLLLDGVNQYAVLESADRLYPSIKPKASPSKVASTSTHRCDKAFQHPSNSPRNMLLRSQKLHEINIDLRVAATNERAILKQKNSDGMQLAQSHPGDFTTSPPHVPPKVDRYKMQVRPRTPDQAFLKSGKMSSTERLSAFATSDPVHKHLRDETFCLCRNLDDESEKVRCSSEHCPIGWFHVGCTKLGRLPTIHERLLCCYCSKAGDEFEIQALEDLTSVDLSNPVTPLVPTFKSYQDEAYRPVTTQSSGNDADEESNGTTTHYTVDTNHGEASREIIVKWRTVKPSALVAGVGDEFPHHSDGFDSQSIASQSPQYSSASLALDSSFEAEQSRTPSCGGEPTDTTILDDLPRTPPQTPVRQVRSGWGTPINLNRLLLSPSNSGPTVSPSKRKYDEIADALS